MRRSLKTIGRAEGTRTARSLPLKALPERRATNPRLETTMKELLLELAVLMMSAKLGRILLAQTATAAAPQDWRTPLQTLRAWGLLPVPSQKKPA
jgi:hypothetical protein